MPASRRGHGQICRSVRSWSHPAPERKTRDFRSAKVLHAELVKEGLHGIGRIPFAIGAGDQQRISFRGQRCRRIALQWQERGYVTLGGKFFGELARQPFS